jgi:hypothetical protein
MTQISQRVTDGSRAQVAKLGAGRAAVTGTLAQIDASLDLIRADVRRIDCQMSVSDPKPTGVPGEFLVNVKLLPVRAHTVQVAAPAPAKHWTRARLGWTVGGTLAAVGLLGWVAYLLVAMIAASIGTVVVVAGLVTVALAAGSRVCTTIVKVTHHH